MTLPKRKKRKIPRVLFLHSRDFVVLVVVVVAAILEVVALGLSERPDWVVVAVAAVASLSSWSSMWKDLYFFVVDLVVVVVVVASEYGLAGLVLEWEEEAVHSWRL